jgi:hypothetical protein
MPQTIYSSLYSGGQTESKTLLTVKMDVFLYVRDYRGLLNVKWWKTEVMAALLHSYKRQYLSVLGTFI